MIASNDHGAFVTLEDGKALLIHNNGAITWESPGTRKTYAGKYGEMKGEIQTNYWVLTGRVQGVGFRPFVYRLAHRLGLAGWVQNQKGRVIILAQGTPKRLSDFEIALLTDSPPLAEPRIQRVGQARFIFRAGFSIRPSRSAQKAEIHVPAARAWANTKILWIGAFTRNRSLVPPAVRACFFMGVSGNPCCPVVEIFATQGKRLNTPKRRSGRWRRVSTGCVKGM
uniref:acylphosphatase n=1 Tax=Candidatus Kentrum sp. TC TaxID=2126339 RepID=A0A450YZL8_9GAMM|nr:MAG: Acylphosphatase [Candidatus Kentron sp. TC]